MKATITIADDEEVGLTVLNRNTRSGADTEAVTVEPGQSVEVEITDDFHLAAFPSAPSAPLDGPGITAPTIQEPKASKRTAKADTDAELREGTDEEVSAALAELRTTPGQLTSRGDVELPVLNKHLEEKGIAPVKADRRTTLQAALPALEPAT